MRFPLLHATASKLRRPSRVAYHLSSLIQTGERGSALLFYKAIQLDPDLLAAYAATASCFCRRKGFGWVIDREQEVAAARRLVLRAVQSGNSAGYVLAYVVGDLDDGAAFLDQALLINPHL